MDSYLSGNFKEFYVTDAELGACGMGMTILRRRGSVSYLVGEAGVPLLTTDCVSK